MACTIKPYSLDLFLSVLLLWLAVRVRLEPQRAFWPAMLAVLIPAAVSLSYPAVFVAGTASLVLAPVLIRKGNRATRGWFLAFNVLLVASFLAHYLLVGREKVPGNPPDLQAYMMSFWANGFPHGGPLESLWWLVRIHAGSLLSYPVEFRYGAAIGAPLAAFGVYTLACQRRGWLVVLCVGPYALHLLAACLHGFPYGMYQRLEQHLMPGFCMLAGMGLATLFERLAVAMCTQSPFEKGTGAVAGRSEGCCAQRCLSPSQTGSETRWVATAAAALLLVGIGGAVTDYRRPYRTEEAQAVRAMIEHLRREMRPDDVILVCGKTKDCHPCVQWHLLRLADRVYESNGPSPLPSARTAERVWVLDTSHEYVAIGSPEPAPIAPDEGRDDLGATAGWQAQGHWRYRASAPGTRSLVFRFYFDLFLCETARAQAAR
jgi:hypothetical protein